MSESKQQIEAEPQNKFDKARTVLGSRAARRIGTVAAIASLGIGIYVGANNKGNGEAIGYDPPVAVEKSEENELKIASWNMHSEAIGKIRSGEVSELVEDEEIDILAMQEVSVRDKQSLEDEFSDRYIRYIKADEAAKPLSAQSDLGNLIMTKSAPRNESVLSIPGTSVFEGAVGRVAGFTQDAFELDSSLDDTKGGKQESRAFSGYTIDIEKPNGDVFPIRFLFGHIAPYNETYPQLQAKQLDLVMDYVASQKIDNGSTVVCADYNAEPDKIIKPLLEHGFDTPKSGPTIVGGQSRADYCSVAYGDDLGLAGIEVLKEHKTDHYPIVMNIPIEE